MKAGKLPKVITICGVPHKVRYMPKIPCRDDEVTYGQYLDRQQVIEISLDHHEDEAQIKRTLLHEALHGLLHVTGQSQGMDIEKEEALVTALEYGLVGLWKQF